MDPELEESAFQRLEERISAALDLFAEADLERAETAVEACIGGIKDLLRQEADAVRCQRLWALCLVALEEYEQALLHYEAILKGNPADEDALWQSASLLLWQLEKPEPALILLRDRLLPIAAKPEYVEAERVAAASVGEPTREPSAPDEAGDEAPPPQDDPPPKS